MLLPKAAVILALSGALLACTASVDNTGPSARDQAVDTASAALTSDTLPDEIGLVDDTVNGLEERVITGHGFVFRALAQSSSGTALVENHSTFALATSIGATVMCVHAGSIYFINSSNTTVSLRSGGPTKSVSFSCNSGDSLRQIAVSFHDITSDAPDVGYQANAFARSASLLSEVGLNAAPNAYVKVGSGLVFKSKLRSTWGSAEYINNGTSAVTVRTLFVQIYCSGNGPGIKKAWGPQNVGPGQSMTATVGCPAGQTVTLISTSFTF